MIFSSVLSCLDLLFCLVPPLSSSLLSLSLPSFFVSHCLHVMLCVMLCCVVCGSACGVCGGLWCRCGCGGRGGRGVCLVCVCAVWFGTLKTPCVDSKRPCVLQKMECKTSGLKAWAAKTRASLFRTRSTTTQQACQIRHLEHYRFHAPVCQVINIRQEVIIIRICSALTGHSNSGLANSFRLFGLSSSRFACTGPFSVRAVILARHSSV